jgi:hypothetical protein
MKALRVVALAVVVAAVSAGAAASPAAAHDPRHMYYGEDGSPCWTHSNDPQAYHWILADIASEQCRTTFASDADWIYSYNWGTGTYQQSPNGEVCTDTGAGCGGYSYEYPWECQFLGDVESLAWMVHLGYLTLSEGEIWAPNISDFLPLTEERASLYATCFGF